MRWLRRTFGGRERLEDLHDESRRLGALLGQIFGRLEPALAPGMTTASIDAAVAAHIAKLGVASMFRELGFAGCCSTSIDNEVINAPPSDRRLETGQLLKLQIGIKGQCTYATQGWTYAIGTPDHEAQRLMTAGREALRHAVAAVRTGAHVGAVSAAIQQRIEADGFSVNRQFVGNGIDTQPHAEPQIPGFGTAKRGPRLRAGTILSLNVIAHAGGFECEVTDDGWTAVTRDRRRAVQFGQMVIVTAGPAEVVTSER